MKKFIVSDLHGDGLAYNSIMNYLDNISFKEDIMLYINGDLIDRGISSAPMLLDVIKRIKKCSYPIVYLGGNHELMLFQTFEKRRKGQPIIVNEWYLNGGKVTDESLEELLNYDREKILEVVDFIGDLDIYTIFEEEQKNKNILLVHAASSPLIAGLKRYKIKDNTSQVERLVWTREEEYLMPFRCRIGNDKFFTIVGHTPNDNNTGFVYNAKDNYLNIDGGCSYYVGGLKEYDHVPLVEVLEDHLEIITFNHNNEIILGNYFDSGNIIPFTEEELNRRKIYTKY